MPSTPVSATLEELEEFLRAGIDPVSAPSVAYGISRGSETVLLGANGFANKELGVLATIEIPYSLASVTKPMTATAIAILADRGMIDLDAPINRYLGDAKVTAMVGDADLATVRRVANHTSGLPTHYQFFYEDEPYRAPEMPETIRRYAKLYNPPGERYQYSNIGFGLLDYVVERVSGRPFAQFMAEEVFEPLGMAQSSIGAQGGEALSYGKDDGVAYPRYGFDHPGASAAYASVEDLLAFGRSHLGLGPQLLSPARRLDMQWPTAEVAGTWGYGFGWSTNEDRLGVRTIGHSGGMSGVNTNLIMVPEQEIVIAILVNGQSSLPFEGTGNALGALLPSCLEKLIEERAVSPAEKQQFPGASSEFWKAWNGSIRTYCGDFALSLTIEKPDEGVAEFEGHSYPLADIEVRDGRLKCAFDGQIPTPDANRREQRIELDLKLREDRLCGAAMTVSKFEGEGGGTPGNRRGNALSYWVELK